MPELSIIVLTWNTSEITKKCVLSIKRSLENKIDYEIIVADNGSTDNTQQVFKDLKFVKYIKLSKNYGFSKGNNLAAKYAKGKYILFLNSDMELLNSRLIDMLRHIKLNPIIGLIGPKFLNVDQSPQGSVFPPQTITNAFREFWLGQKSYSKYTPATDKPIEVWAVSGGAVIIDRSLFEKIGGWDTRYFMFYEDLELCRQIKKLNYKIFFYPQCSLVHHHGASGKNLASNINQWRRLIPSSKIFHGLARHFLINSTIWSGQKYQKIKRLFG
ncbi:MAG: glycosyltransferase family 2 protein [Candidatus Shapirobacteria bacterium]|jgi:hypothetical protein